MLAIAIKPRSHCWFHVRAHHALVVWLIAVTVVGCASSEWIKVRDTPRNPLAGSLDLLAPGGPKPTERTMQLLRRYDLEKDLDGDRAILLARLEEIQRREPYPEHEYAIAEVAYITAKQAETMHPDRALEFYGTALIHAYRYLFECVDKRGWCLEPAQSDVASNEQNGLRNSSTRLTSIRTTRSSAACRICTTNLSKACCGWYGRRASCGPECRVRSKRRTIRARLRSC